MQAIKRSNPFLSTTPRAKQARLYNSDDKSTDLTVKSYLETRRNPKILVSLEPDDEAESLSATLQYLLIKSEAMSERIESLERWAKDDGDKRLPMLEFNLLVDFVNNSSRPFRVFYTFFSFFFSFNHLFFAINKADTEAAKAHKKGSLSEGGTQNDHDASTIRIIQMAENISKGMLEKAAQRGKWPLQPKFFAYTKKLSLDRNDRNCIAHRSGTQFAKLLCHPLYRDSRLYHEWAGLMEFVYEKKLEDIASETDSEKDNQKEGQSKTAEAKKPGPQWKY
ncbi:MAG: hypothetical protein Q9202_004040 [Teloschistes flavicans]